jgi:hypothetical protein
MGPQPNESNMNKDRTLLYEWLAVQAQLKSLKATELKLRNKLIERIDPKKPEGSQTLDFQGTKLTVKTHLNYSPDQAELAIYWDDLTEIEKGAVRTKFEIMPARYRTLPADCKLRQLVTVKPGQPALEIKE